MSASPGPRRPPAWYESNPHARSSFSRLATHRRCPAWYRYQYLEWHRSPSPAVARAGQAVQDAFERIVDSEPSPDVTLEALEERARERALVYLGQAWERAAAEHERDPNGLGAFDLPRDRYEGHLQQAVRLHLREVRARLDRAHPRTGHALPSLPAVRDVRQAWLAVRPGHAPPGESPVATMEAVPGGYFQGQCDLVYDWTGARRLVDLKASAGRSPFSTEIRLQLVAYAFLDRELGRDRPEGLEAWFLGQPEPLLLDLPGEEEMDAFDAEVLALIRRSGHEEDGYRAYRAEDFPPEPAALPAHRAAAGEPSAWCSLCPAAPVCPRSARRAPPCGRGVAFDRIPADAPPGGLAAEGIVLGVGEPVDKGGGRTRRRFTLANASGAMSFGWDADVVLRLAEEGLRAGRHVRVTGLNPWRPPSGDAVLLFPTPRTRCEVVEPELFWPPAAAGPEPE